ncbi:MAG: EF-P lysine aminoacylase GenX [Bradymonadales bacterium]|nr:EF-P lysine aminoacylase GenX [Bradymonadales bacterium]
MIDPTRLVPLRHRFLRAVRNWFHDQGFAEVDTPIAVRSPGMEPHLEAFQVSAHWHPPNGGPLYLHTSPEYHMKRILASYQRPIFQLCHCFRDEPVSRLHNPEFTMLEWYRPGEEYTRLMTDCEQLFGALADEFTGGGPLELPEGSIPIGSGFERVTVQEVYLKHAGLDPLACREGPDLVDAARRAGFDVPDHWPWEDVFHYILLEAVEHQLGKPKPTILYGYPPRLAALSRIEGGLAQRFELYLGGQELANAFGELVDPTEQRARFEQDQELRRQLGRPVYPIDERLLSALGEIDKAAGIALGLDRLWLLFCEHLIGRRLSLADVLWAGL